MCKGRKNTIVGIESNLSIHLQIERGQQGNDLALQASSSCRPNKRRSGAGARAKPEPILIGRWTESAERQTVTTNSQLLTNSPPVSFFGIDAANTA